MLSHSSSVPLASFFRWAAASAACHRCSCAFAGCGAQGSRVRHESYSRPHGGRCFWTWARSRHAGAGSCEGEGSERADRCSPPAQPQLLAGSPAGLRSLAGPLAERLKRRGSPQLADAQVGMECLHVNCMRSVAPAVADGQGARAGPRPGLPDSCSKYELTPTSMLYQQSIRDGSADQEPGVHRR